MTAAQGQAAALSVRQLGKSFGGSAALADVDLDVMTGHVHALVGENGSGKSTLIKIISGYHRPDSGTVMIGGTTGILGEWGPENFANRYEGGVDTHLQAITVETIELANERNAIDILRRRMDASVLLVKALGGGWTVSNLPTFGAQRVKDY